MEVIIRELGQREQTGHQPPIIGHKQQHPQQHYSREEQRTPPSSPLPCTTTQLTAFPWTTDNPYLHTSGGAKYELTDNNMKFHNITRNHPKLPVPGLVPYLTSRPVRADEQYPSQTVQYHYQPYCQPLFSSLSSQYCCPGIMGINQHANR